MPVINSRLPPDEFPGSDKAVTNPGGIPFWTPLENNGLSFIPSSLTAGSQLFYSSAINQTTVVQDLGTTLQVASITGLPVYYPFKLLLEWGSGNQEVVVVTQAATPAGTGAYQFANCMRGQDGGGPQIVHAVGAQVNHGVSAQDMFQAQPVFNVCAYGADPSGITDSTTGINNAIIACGEAGGGIVAFPTGTFACSGAIVVNFNNVTLMGSAGYGYGTRLTYIPTTAGRAAAIVVGSITNVWNSNILNLTVDAGGAGLTSNISGVIQAGSGHGIIFRSQQGLIQNVQVQFPNGDGIHMSMDTAAVPAIMFDVVLVDVYVKYPNASGVSGTRGTATASSSSSSARVAACTLRPRSGRTGLISRAARYS